jgi:hypothetical protein
MKNLEVVYAAAKCMMILSLPLRQLSTKAFSLEKILVPPQLLG